MTIVEIILLLLSCAALGEVAYSLVMAYRGLREAREAPFVEQALHGPQPEQWPNVSIVVPAHNEERVAAGERGEHQGDSGALRLVRGDG